MSLKLATFGVDAIVVEYDSDGEKIVNNESIVLSLDIDETESLAKLLYNCLSCIRSMKFHKEYGSDVKPKKSPQIVVDSYFEILCYNEGNSYIRFERDGKEYDIELEEKELISLYKYLKNIMKYSENLSLDNVLDNL